MTIDELIKKTPAFLSTDQCHVIEDSLFPRAYKNQAGKRLRIECFFNGSIVAYKKKIYFCCRGDQKPFFHNIRLIFCELDEDFNPKKGTARFLEVGSNLDDKGSNGEYRVEDPRLFVSGDKLHIAYTDGFEMYHAVFNDDIKIDKWKNITNFGLNLTENDHREKNWCPFDYEGKPHFVYSDNPRVIWCPFNRKAYLSEQRINWKYGPIRGGTPAIPYNNKLLTFFHSAQNINQSYLGGRLYYMGAYMFSRTPPFKVTHMTQTPLLRGERLHENLIVPDMAVVFPAGVIANDDSFFVSLGINDRQTGVIRIQKHLIESCLIPLKQAEA